MKNLLWYPFTRDYCSGAITDYFIQFSLSLAKYSSRRKGVSVFWTLCYYHKAKLSGAMAVCFCMSRWWFWLSSQFQQSPKAQPRLLFPFRRHFPESWGRVGWVVGKHHGWTPLTLTFDRGAMQPKYSKLWYNVICSINAKCVSVSVGNRYRIPKE